MTHPRNLLAGLAMLATAAACGGSEGQIRVHLVDAPGDFQALTLDVQKVEIQRDGDGWIELGSPNRQVDLLSLTGGVSETLVDGTALPAGTYTQLRLVLGPANTVTLRDGTVHDLVVPSGQRSGVKLPGSFTVAADTTRDVFIDFDAHRSVFVHDTGHSEKWMLRPVVRAVDRLVTGAITGTLTDAATAAPLSGALVTAQSVVNGQPSIVRAAVTAADGSYVLDLLDAGASYHVVAQPVVAGVAYAAQASAPIAIAEEMPVARFDAAFASAPAGALAGTIAPVATEAQADEVQLTQVLDAGGTPTAFVVRTVAGAVGPEGETWAADALPAGDYAAAVVRRTVGADGSETSATGATVDVTVSSGATAIAALAAP